MNETFLSIESLDGHLIHGVLNGINDSSTLLVFVHGLTGEKENHLYYNGARFFPQHGIHTYRFDLFSNNEKGRTLTDCSILTFSDDLSCVIGHFSERYSEIHVVGHSIGGCVAMGADQSLVTSLLLWDTGLHNAGTGKAEKVNNPFVYDEHSEKFIAKLKIEYFLSPKLLEQRSLQNSTVVTKVIRPIKLIFAGNTTIKDSWISCIEHIKTYYEVVTINGAGHGFNEYGMNDRLFDETLSWITKLK